MASIRISEDAIMFIKRFRTICVAGQITDERANPEHHRKWLGAIIHADTHKLILNTPPVFKTKRDAIFFMEELRAKAKRELVVAGQLVSLN